MSTDKTKETTPSPYEGLDFFAASKLKLDRAEKHITEVKKIRDEYLESKPISLVVEKWSDVKSIPHAAWTFRIRNTPPNFNFTAIW